MSQRELVTAASATGLTTRVDHGPLARAGVLEGWQQILVSNTDGVRGPAATCSPLWAEAVVATHLRNAALQTLAVSRGDSIEAVFPLYREDGGRRFGTRVMRLVHQSYPGRCGWLVRGHDTVVASLALDRLRDVLGGWDVMVCRVVDGSPGHNLIIEAARRSGLAVRSIGHNDSPYFDLPASWPELLASLPKKTRWTIKKGESDLARAGKLEYQEYRDPGDVQALLEALVTVERNSWKERDGTSITSRDWENSFYENLLPRLATAGVLSGHVLRLDRAPIAYILGVAEPSGVFLDLKESFDLAQAKSSPGHVLKRFAIERLIERGLRTYDFMGRCEPYKMRWTDRTYRTLTLAVYNRTLRGALAGWKTRIKDAAPRFQARNSGPGELNDPE